MSSYVPVCDLGRLLPERGAAVLVGGRQVALFRIVEAGEDLVYAIGHHDPFSDANVMARGLVGSAGDRTTVASPMYKNVFDLVTGECLGDAEVRLPVYRTWVREGVVHVDPEPVRAVEERPVQVSA